MPTLTEQFSAEHFVLNSITERRQAQVLVALARLQEHMHKPLELATDNDLRDWLLALKTIGLAPSTIAWYLRMVTPFYTWCWERHHIDAEQLMRLRSVSPPRGHSVDTPRPYSRKELGRMWTQLDAKFPYTTDRIIQRWKNGTSPWRSVRKHAMRTQLDAIIELALVCGMRRSEIYRLSVDDCHWDNKYIVVHGKRENQNPKVREVPYPYSTRMAIYHWFRLRGQLSPAPGLPIWLSVTGPDPAAGLREERMAMILHSFGDWTLHRLRHTCATERLRAGMSMMELRDFLGHADIAMTQRYAKLIREDIHKATERSDHEFQRAIRAA